MTTPWLDCFVTAVLCGMVAAMPAGRSAIADEAQEPKATAGADRPPSLPLLAAGPGSPIPTQAGALGAADTNNDGCADLVFCDATSLNVFFGDRQRAWQHDPDRTGPIAGRASEIVFADFNRDGNQDIALADHDSYAVSILLGSGDGTFQPSSVSPVIGREGPQPHTHGLAVADVNGDGDLDIMLANYNDGDVSLLLGDGRGGFARSAHSPFACGPRPYPIAAADINGDGFADVLIPNSARDVKTLNVLLGGAEGKLTPAAGSPLTCEASVWYAATGDLNGDGQLDVVATHTEGVAGITLLINEGQGRLTLAPSSPIPLNHGAWGVAVVDMNDDGNADLVVAASESIQLFLGDGRGHFVAASGSPFATGKGAWRLVMADFNADHHPDVATKCVEADRIDILMGQ